MSKNTETPSEYSPEIAEQAAAVVFASGNKTVDGSLQKSTLGRTKAWAILIFIGCIWGITFSLAKIATEAGGHPLGINYWQSLIGAFFLIILGAITRQKYKLKRAHILFYLACGLLGTVIPGTLYYYAASRVSPGVLSITVATVPLMTFAAAAIFRIEKLQAVRILGIIMGIFSIILLVGPENSLPDPSMVPWVLLVLLSAVCYSAENLIIALRMPKEVNVLMVAGGMYITATLIMSPIVFATGTFVTLAWPWGSAEWAIMGLSFITVIAYSLFIYLIVHAGPVFASQTAYVVTFSGVFWGIIIFDEQHSGWIWASLVMMIIALVLVKPREEETI